MLIFAVIGYNNLLKSKFMNKVVENFGHLNLQDFDSASKVHQSALNYLSVTKAGDLERSGLSDHKFTTKRTN